MTKAPPASSARGRQAARGRELLADSGGLWSALPVEWPHESKARGAARTEDELPGSLWRVRQTLAALLLRPRRSFAFVQEPVDHGALLRFLLAVRLPAWGVLLAVLAVRMLQGSGGAIALRPAHALLDPRLVEALSAWLLLMVPVGLPLLYFALGIATHVALALTGGAPRSIAATMRAVGYALAPVLLGVALLDLPLFLGALPSVAYLGALGALCLLAFVLVGNALTGTHQIAAARGFLVALVPTVLFAAAQLPRATLALDEVPGWAPPAESPYFVP